MLTFKRCLPLPVLVAVLAFQATPALAAPPPSDDFGQPAGDLGFGTSQFYGGESNTEATGQVGEADHASASLGAGCTSSTTPDSSCNRSVWYVWTAPKDGPTVINTCSAGTTLDTTLAVYTGTAVNALSEVGSNDDTAGCDGGTGSRVSFTAAADGVYRIAVAGKAAAQGSFDLRLYQNAPALANDGFAGASALSGSVVSRQADNVGASGEASEPNHAGFSLGESAGTPFCTSATSPDTGCVTSVWYSWTAPASGNYALSTCGAGTDFDTTLAVYTGSALNALTLVDENDDAELDCPADPVRSKVAFAATAGTVYRFAVAGYAAHVGQFQLDLAPEGGGNPGGGGDPGGDPGGGGSPGGGATPGGGANPGVVTLVDIPELGGSSAAGSATASKSGVVTLKRPRVDCVGAGGDCKVSNSATGSLPANLATTSAKGRRTVKLGRSSYTVRAGRTGTIKFKLSRKARRLLERARRIKAKLKIRVTRADKVVRKTVRVTIKAPRRRR